jgi:Ca2+-transporting ATPase
LVWLNSDRISGPSAAGAGLGVGLWLVLLTMPGLMPLLGLGPLQTPEVITVVAGAVIATVLAALVTRSPS